MAATYNLVVERGSTKPDKVWRLMSRGLPFDGTGSTFVLTIKSGTNTIRKDTADNDGLTYDAATGRLRWHRTLAESRLIAAGTPGRYEIERRVGADQSVLVGGAILGRGGLNDD